MKILELCSCKVENCIRDDIPEANPSQKKKLQCFYLTLDLISGVNCISICESVCDSMSMSEKGCDVASRFFRLGRTFV